MHYAIHKSEDTAYNINDRPPWVKKETTYLLVYRGQVFAIDTNASLWTVKTYM